jgi:hypothetical protein
MDPALSDLTAAATPAAVFPLAVKQVLGMDWPCAIADLEQKIPLRGWWTAAGRLEAKLYHWLRRIYSRSEQLAPGEASPTRTRLAALLRHRSFEPFTVSVYTINSFDGVGICVQP